MARINKNDRVFWFYEHSVQSPKIHVAWFAGIYKEIRGVHARHFREDFCGTFAMSCEWVKRNRHNTATAVDLDPVPLQYGMKVNRARLSVEQRKRLNVLQENVLAVKTGKVDFIVAGNFSFFVFQERPSLVQYFRSCLKALDARGVLVLELAGGPGMIETVKERKQVRPSGAKEAFTYTWDQKSFDPVTHRARYAIHFKYGRGDKAVEIKDAFTYDWRLWTIPEVREALHEAGFKNTQVLWETEHKGQGTGEFVRSEVGDNAYSWIAYVIGLK